MLSFLGKIFVTQNDLCNYNYLQRTMTKLVLKQNMVWGHEPIRSY